MDFVKCSLINVGKLVTFALVDDLMSEGLVSDTIFVSETDVLRLEYLVVDALVHALLQVCGVGRAS